MKPISEECKKIASMIGSFYFNKNNGNYEATEKEVLKLEIYEIEVTTSSITIFTRRPGLLIGKKGENINKLEEYLQRKINIMETDCLNDYLLCRRLDGYEEEDLYFTNNPFKEEAELKIF